MGEAEPEWRPVTRWEGFYEVSSAGDVRSLPRQTVKGIRGGQLLKLHPDPKGYYQVTLTRPGVREYRRVHQLVAEAFIGPCPPGHETRHHDGDNQHNAASNLLYGTSGDNKLDQVRHGTHPNASKNCCPKCGGPFTISSDGGRRCKACKREQTQQWRKDHPERTRELGRAQNRRWRAKDPERARAIGRASDARRRAQKKQEG